jgi:hypothetical protein
LVKIDLQKDFNTTFLSKSNMASIQLTSTLQFAVIFDKATNSQTETSPLIFFAIPQINQLSSVVLIKELDLTATLGVDPETQYASISKLKIFFLQGGGIRLFVKYSINQQDLSDYNLRVIDCGLQITVQNQS